MAFEKGDVVVLKSGGPKMTVANTGNYGPLGPENGVQCTWFEKTKLQSEIFPEEVLEKAADDLGSLRVSFK